MLKIQKRPSAVVKAATLPPSRAPHGPDAPDGVSLSAWNPLERNAWCWARWWARLCPPPPHGQPQGCRVQAAGKCRHLRGSRRSAGRRKARPLSPAGRGVQRLRGHGVPRLAAGGHQPGQDRLRGRLRPRQQGRGPLHPAEAVPRAPVPAREDPQQGACAPRAQPRVT